MITIYHLENSRSERIIWLMEELELPYQVERFERRKEDTFAPADLKQIHELGRAPVIRDGDTVLAESGAIVQYIIALYGGGRLAVDPGAPDFAHYLYWLHYAEGSLMLQLLRETSLNRFLPDPDAVPGMARVRDNTRQHLEFIDAALAVSPYFAGESFTAADLMMAFPFTTLLQFLPKPLKLAPYQNLQAHLARITARPAYRKAMAVADPEDFGASVAP